jgi:hypothetical protein
MVGDVETLALGVGRDAEAERQLDDGEVIAEPAADQPTATATGLTWIQVCAAIS